MNVQEWALIIFTIIAQMSVGSFVILGGVHFFATRKYGVEAADKLSDRALLAIGPVLVLGMLATFLHLGNPINAPRAISNLGSSWLSAEIALAVAFVVGGGIFAFMQWRKIATPNLRNIIALVVAAVGLALVYAMAMIYMLPTVPFWNSIATPVTFFITTFLLGALAIGAALVVNYVMMRGKEGTRDEVQFDMLATTLRWVSLIAVVLLGLQFIVIPLHVAQLATDGSTAAQESMALLMGEYGLLFALRLLLVFLGAGVFSIFIYQMATSAKGVQVLGNLAYLAFALVLVGEVMGRFLFYASMVRIGL